MDAARFSGQWGFVAISGRRVDCWLRKHGRATGVCEIDGWRPRISQQWRILLVRINIYRPAGVRSDPRKSRRLRVLRRCGSRARVADGGEKEGHRPRITPKWRILAVNRNTYRSERVRSDSRKLRRPRGVVICYPAPCVGCRSGAGPRAGKRRISARNMPVTADALGK